MHCLTSSNELPKTAAPPPELSYNHFVKLPTLEEAIVCNHRLSEFSRWHLDNIMIYDVPPTIVVYDGPEMIGTGFFTGGTTKNGYDANSRFA